MAEVQRDVGPLESKYILNLEDVIMELSEEQLSSMMDDESMMDGSPKESFLQQIL